MVNAPLIEADCIRDFHLTHKHMHLFHQPTVSETRKGIQERLQSVNKFWNFHLAAAVPIEDIPHLVTQKSDLINYFVDRDASVHVTS
jgi:hypothetical protein